MTVIVAGQKILLAKIEGTYGTDPTPTVAANAIEAMDIKFDYPFEVLERDLQVEDLSPHTNQAGKQMVTCNFTTEVKAGGTRGTAGRLSPLYQSCSLLETATGATSVIYNPTSSAQKSCTIYVYEVNSAAANYKLHEMNGAVGNPELIYEAGQIAKISWTFQGLYNIPVDVSDPGNPTYESTVPVTVKSAQFSLNSVSLIINRLSVNLNNEISERPSVSAATSIAGYRITKRRPSFTIDPETQLMTDYDFQTDIIAGTARDLILELGTVSGNIHRISGAAGVSTVGMENRNGIAVDAISGHFVRTSGNDEVQIKET